jgi:hypothetical protein
MSEEISSPFQITNREFVILRSAIEARQKKLRADAERCRKAYTGKASTGNKIVEYLDEADELGRLLSDIATEFS